MDLITIGSARIDGEETQTVNARELHAFLENKDHFATWIKDRIAQYDFAENRDFVTYSENTEKGRPRFEYALTLDMAKELAMVERNEKGKQARAYFIECERRAKAASANPAQLSRLDLIRIAMEAEQERLALTSKVDEMKPDVDAFHRLAKSDGSFCITDAAKALNQQPKRLFDYLKAKGWIYRRVGGKHWLGYQDKVQSGMLAHITTTISLADGTDRLKEQVVITPKGLARLAKDFPPPTVAA